MRYASINPVNNKLLRSFPTTSRADILSTIERSERAFERFSRLALSERVEQMLDLSKLIEARQRRVAEVITS